MIFFQDVLQAHKLEKVEEITGIQMQEGEVEPKGETLVGPTWGGVETSRYNYHILSTKILKYITSNTAKLPLHLEAARCNSRSESINYNIKKLF